MKLLDSFDALFSAFRPYFKSSETFERGRSLAFCSAFTYGRRTISRLICSKNEQHNDWSADYKFFSLREWNAADLFVEVLKECDEHSYWPAGDVLVALDETLRKKTGKKIPGVATLRDPMSLPYHVNLTPGLRYLQAACIITPDNKVEYNRAIPIYFQEAAPAKKPKRNASDAEKEHYKKEQKAKRITVKGHEAALKIRTQIDQLPAGQSRRLFITADGSFANRNFLRGLPENIIPVVRVRKDLKLFKPADSVGHRKGRHRIYGERLPTPEEIRQDDGLPYQRARIFAAGKYHEVRHKTMAPVLWQKGTARTPCRLIVIAPLGYRLTKGSKLLYRQPAYLLIPDTETPVESLLQYYFLRWDIEVNHRDEKSLLGLGDAQLRSPKSVKRQPQFSVLIYSLLLLASIRAYGAQRTEDYLPIPKWRKKTERRPSTLDIVSQFRREVMIAQLQRDFEWHSKPKKTKKRKRKRPRSNIVAQKRGFRVIEKEQQSALKLPINVISALLYADS